MYLFGMGMAKDGGEAQRWYRKAADQGDAQAAYGLGGMYYLGNGVVKDSAKRRAGSAGLPTEATRLRSSISASCTTTAKG